MKYSPGEIRAIKMSPKGQLPRFLQNSSRTGGRKVGMPPTRESIGAGNVRRKREGKPLIRINRKPALV